MELKNGWELAALVWTMIAMAIQFGSFIFKRAESEETVVQYVKKRWFYHLLIISGVCIVFQIAVAHDIQGLKQGLATFIFSCFLLYAFLLAEWVYKTNLSCRFLAKILVDIALAFKRLLMFATAGIRKK